MKYERWLQRASYTGALGNQFMIHRLSPQLLNELHMSYAEFVKLITECLNEGIEPAEIRQTVIAEVRAAGGSPHLERLLCAAVFQIARKRPEPLHVINSQEIN